MEYIKIDENNLESEHICCAISKNNDPQVCSKKEWIRENLAKGLVFLKADARGKCFIEYMPAENAWQPIKADGYNFINCFWISGSLKGNGYANELLSACIEDSRQNGKKGICVISSKKKLSFLSDPKYLAYKGFITADCAEPYFELLYLPFENNAEKPCFLPCAKKPHINKSGVVIYYTAQCPYNAKYIQLIKDIAEKNKAGFQAIKITSADSAKGAPTAHTSFTMFYNGEFVTHEILSEKKFQKFCDENIL